jgi:sugar phosphate isomerase/epimerase
MQTRRDFVGSIAATGAALTLPVPVKAAPAGMFVALNTSLTNNQVQWPEFVRLAARVGYGGADFNLGTPMKDGAAATAELYRSLNLRPSFCNLPVNPTADEDVYRKGMDALEDAAKFVSAIGGHCMMLVVLPSSPTPKNELRALMKERLKPASDLLGKYNLRLGLEFLGPKYFRTRAPYEFIWRMDEMFAFGREIGPNVGVVLDSWHWHHAGATAADIVSAGKSGIILVHISDAAGANPDDVRDNRRLLPGEGIIDFTAFFGALKKIGFEGSISPEPLGRIPKDMPAEEGARIGLESTLSVMRKAGVA